MDDLLSWTITFRPEGRLRLFDARQPVFGGGANLFNNDRGHCLAVCHRVRGSFGFAGGG